jgi:hypothetical protein
MKERGKVPCQEIKMVIETTLLIESDNVNFELVKLKTQDDRIGWGIGQFDNDSSWIHVDNVYYSLDELFSFLTRGLGRLGIIIKKEGIKECYESKSLPLIIKAINPDDELDYRKDLLLTTEGNQNGKN